MTVSNHVYNCAAPFLLAVCFIVTGCTVGPDFKTPPPPVTSGYSKQPLNNPLESTTGAGGNAQEFVSGQDIPAQWWSLFRSQPLDALIKRALNTNPDLQSAQAAVRVAMENVKAQIGGYYPTIGAGFNASRNKNAAQLSPVLASSTLLYNLYQAQLSVSWTPDIWGGNRRQVEALTAQADAQRYQLRAIHVALTSNIVAAAIQEAALREQIAATNAIIAGERRILEIEQRQKALGQIGGADVAAQQVVLAQAEQLLPTLQKQLAQQRDLLTALAGNLPADEIEETFSLYSLTLPDRLPLTLPSKLVEQRPDIRMAEENMHAAIAEIGVSVANMLPNITLSASDGTVATTFAQLFSPGNGFWNVGAGVVQPVFDGGALLHRSRAARAAYDQAAAQYRSTVITAFQNVADTLHAIQSDGEVLQTAVAAQTAAAKSLAIAQNQVSAGQIGRITLLNAEQAYQQTRIALIQAQANRFGDTAALFQALGGGWWNDKVGEVQ
jgi:NodT family efflux transporter outer membrane factor (OMF) lipoprotein